MEADSTPEVEPAAKRRKRRKKGKSSSAEAAGAAGLAYPAQRILLELELWGAEIDQQAVLNAGRAQITQDLGHMLVRQGLGSLEFYDTEESAAYATPKAAEASPSPLQKGRAGERGYSVSSIPRSWQ